MAWVPEYRRAVAAAQALVRASILIGEIRNPMWKREKLRESRTGDVQCNAPPQPVERLARTAIGQLLSAALNRSHHPSHGALALSQPAAAETTMLLYAGKWENQRQRGCSAMEDTRDVGVEEISRRGDIYRSRIRQVNGKC